MTSKDETAETRASEPVDGAAAVDVRAELLAPEASLGSTPQGRSAGACMRALARASRAYLIYEPSNEVIKTFLEDVQRSLRSHLSEYGELDLRVRPFELALVEEVVYRELDWERSLAFKLFRDGVRRLTIGSGATWEELIQFLGILSIRYVGVNMDEDDVLTLLWKASFKHIAIEAVEGFVPTDDEDAPDLSADGAVVQGFLQTFTTSDSADRAPSDFDLPAPELLADEPPSYFPVAEGVRVSLREEYGSRQLPRDLVQLVGALMAAIEDPADLTSISEAAPFLAEIRDFLLNEEEVDLLLEVARRIARARAVIGQGTQGAGVESSADRESLDTLVDGFASVPALRRILATVPESSATPPASYEGLLELHRGDSLQILFELLEVERSSTARRFTRQLIERHLPHRVDDVIKRFGASSPAVAADLLRVLASGAEEASRGLFNEVVHRGVPEVKLEFLNQIGGVVAGNQRAFLVLLLNAPEPAVRVRALEVVGRLGERGGWQPVHRQLQNGLAAGAAEEELDALGRALSRLDPDRAVKELLPLADKKGLFHSFRPKEVRRRRAAVAAMCDLAVRPDVRPTLERVALKDDECGELARSALGMTPASAPPAAASLPAPAPEPAAPPRRAMAAVSATRRTARPRSTTPLGPADLAPWEEGGGDAAPVLQGGHAARAQLRPRAAPERPPVEVPMVPITASSEFEFELEDDE